MKKFFSFSGTINGKIFFLRTLFTLVLTLPVFGVLISKWTAYVMSLGNFDVYDTSPENLLQIEFFADELAQKIAENYEFYSNDFIDSFTAGWIFMLIISAMPSIWFILSTYYKRVSALFFDHRIRVFTSIILFELVSYYISFNNPGLISSIMSLIWWIIFAFLILVDSKFENHEG
tara:strand:- start:155 stop:679 length:525 start_codon:yes stop_codon:yes gene_type:complete